MSSMPSYVYAPAAAEIRTRQNHQDERRFHEEAVLAEASLRRTWLAEPRNEAGDDSAMGRRVQGGGGAADGALYRGSGYEPNVRGLTGQARQYDNTLQRTATPPDYMPPPPKAARRKTEGRLESAAAGGPLACLVVGLPTTKTSTDDIGCWPQAAVEEKKLNSSSSPTPQLAKVSSTIPLLTSLRLAIGHSLEGGPSGASGQTRPSFVDAWCNGPTSERTPTRPIPVGWHSAGVLQRTSANPRVTPTDCGEADKAKTRMQPHTTDPRVRSVEAASGCSQ